MVALRTPRQKATKRAADDQPATAEQRPTLSCRFFVTDAGNEPVRDWLKELEPDVRREIGSDIQMVQWRWPIGKPLVDGFGEGPEDPQAGPRSGPEASETS